MVLIYSRTWLLYNVYIPVVDSVCLWSGITWSWQSPAVWYRTLQTSSSPCSLHLTGAGTRKTVIFLTKNKTGKTGKTVHKLQMVSILLFLNRFTDQPTPSFPKNKKCIFFNSIFLREPKPQTAAYSTYFRSRLLNATLIQAFTDIEV